MNRIVLAISLTTLSLTLYLQSPSIPRSLDKRDEGK